MNKTKVILYIGNNLAGNTKYPTTMETLSNLLEQEKYTFHKTSDKTNIFLRLLDMCFSIVKYRKIIDYILIDTYSTKNFYFAFLTSQIARIFKLKYIPILHGGNLPNRIENSKRKSNMIFKNAFKNISPSGFLKNEFEKRNYVVELIPNIIQIEKYTFKKRDKIKPKLLFVRAFSEIYNPKMAIEVLDKVKKTYPNAKLCMIGPDRDGSLKGVQQLTKDLHLENSVEFTGVLSKTEWHKKSEEFDIFINTTNIDNTPVSVIEAMALGMPVVSTNVGGLPYLIKNDIDGVLVPKEDTNEMCEAILKIIKENNNQLASNARKKVEAFGWENVKYKWFDILK